MPNLFGLNIAKLVNDSIRGAGNVRPGVLSHSGPPYVRDIENLSGGVVPTVTTHEVSGFVEQKETRRSDQIGTTYESTISILGDSVNPKITPTVNDMVVMDGVTYTLIELLSVDPSAALYDFRAQT